MPTEPNSFGQAVSDALITPATDFYEKVSGTNTVSLIKEAITNKAPINIYEMLDPDRVINDISMALNIPDSIDKLKDYYKNIPNMDIFKVENILDVAAGPLGLSENMIDVFGEMYHGIQAGRGRETLTAIAGTSIHNFAAAGKLPLLSKMSAIVGSDAVSALAPNAVSTALRNFKLDTIGRDDVLADYDNYAKDTFLPSLSTIDRTWDTLSGVSGDIKDLTSYGNLTKDAKWLLNSDMRSRVFVTAGECLDKIRATAKANAVDNLLEKWDLV